MRDINCSYEQEIISCTYFEYYYKYKSFFELINICINHYAKKINYALKAYKINYALSPRNICFPKTLFKSCH